MQNSDELVSKQTLKWVTSFIVDLNVCPFAKREVEHDSIRLSVVRSKKTAFALEELMAEIAWLDENTETETSLVVFPTLFSDFESYLDFVAMTEDIMFEQGYEGTYQVATFHPDYCFDGVEQDDVSNYTNRSPYPMIHLLREASVEKAIEFYGDTTGIPDDNIALMEEMGLEKVETILQSCLKPESAE
ncbi:hypothetical protein TW85_12040 [Marinomonas sp. S3726]|uniref:DUF1415 domain-containing protein n=1 Tax=Marinomonas sp. S3726 TaxID=579484 RepID=UPI0005FA3793|nr:DUF1415 domain-containing protein [Marinomonas sp. S3726]KJZ13914.1 hypothetical protein TW85_12040 [Marinomonas sp. S3726]